MRKIILMSEYHCYPLWEIKEDGLVNFESYEIDIPERLAKRIEDWGDQFESTYNVDDPASSGFRSENEEKEFAKTGGFLAKELRSVLSRDFEIEYRMLGGEKLQM